MVAGHNRLTMTLVEAAVRPSGMAPWVMAGAGAAAVAYVGLADPVRGNGAFVPCPFHAVTGLWCPGCGLTRAVHHLARLDVPAALSSNLLVPLVLVLVGWLWLAWVWPRVPAITRVVPSWAWPALAGLAVAFAVLRNLPVDALRTLAP
jgi:hypothetical protein